LFLASELPIRLDDINTSARQALAISGECFMAYVREQEQETTVVATEEVLPLSLVLIAGVMSCGKLRTPSVLRTHAHSLAESTHTQSRSNYAKL